MLENLLVQKGFVLTKNQMGDVTYRISIKNKHLISKIINTGEVFDSDNGIEELTIEYDKIYRIASIIINGDEWRLTESNLIEILNMLENKIITISC